MLPVCSTNADDPQLPRFNPALGTLLSVDLDLSISIFGQMDTHCASPIMCNAEATAIVRSSSFPDLSAGGPGNVDGAGGLTFSGLGADVILALLEVSYELFLNDVFANHNVAYSDAHLYANELVTARVGYAYEPAVKAVPEPGLATLVGLGIAGLNVRRRLWNRRR